MRDRVIQALKAGPPMIGPFRRDFWRSPIRGPWLTSVLGSALLPLIVICAATGFLSHEAYDTSLGRNSLLRGGALDLDIFRWPTAWAWLYAFTQGLHVVTGVAAIPILLAKLWSVLPKLFEHPPVRSIAHALERLSLALLVGGSLFVFFTGVANIQIYYPWKFSFVPAHYYGAFIFLAGLTLHLVIKVPVALRSYRRMGVVRPLREDREHTVPEPASESVSVSTSPGPTSVSRRALLGWVGAASAGLAVMTSGQVIGGPFRRLAFLAPRGQSFGDGPNDFPVNKTAAGRHIEVAETGPSWRLELTAARSMSVSRQALLTLDQQTVRLPIACVEGWSTTQEWSGVRLSDLARMVDAEDAEELLVESLQKRGGFRQATLNSGQVADDRSLLALRVNGADLSLDHGYPARIIVPALPGVHCTKWVSRMTFKRA